MKNQTPLQVTIFFIKRNFFIGSEKITKGFNFAIKFAENREIRMNLKSIWASMISYFEGKSSNFFKVSEFFLYFMMHFELYRPWILHKQIW